jgi:hypothetical protein
MRFYNRVLCCVAAGVLLINSQMTVAWAADAYPVFTDINKGGEAFGVANASSFGGIYTVDDTRSLNGNAVLQINQKGQLACCHGAQFEINVSNGENGVNSTNGGANVDIPNATPANPVFAAIGNASGKLENGNVIRFSAWYRSDPANPITQDPQVQPIMKIEYWKEALSTFADTNATQAAPQFGDRVFDQDQQGQALGIPDLPTYIDLNGDGIVGDPNATVANGRVKEISTTAWTLVSVTHTVNSADWLGIGPEAFGANDVTKIEQIKGVMFMGDFANTDLTGDGPDGGNLLVDNAKMEVFKNAASVTPIVSPDPSLSEGVPGDYNHNGKVDAADYVIWRNGGSPTPNSLADYNTWRTNFGNHTGSGLGAQSSVPEPSVMMLAIGAVLSLASAYRRR